jgi:hypothetical protein
MGDHLLREPLDHVLAEGLEIEELERHWFGVVERLAARKAAPYGAGEDWKVAAGAVSGMP